MTREDIIREADAWLKMNGVVSDGQTCFRMALFAQHITALAAEPAKPKFDHSIGAERFKVVRGTFWWHVKIGDSPTEHGKFRSSKAAQKMADDLIREFRNGAFVQNALAAEPTKQEALCWFCHGTGYQKNPVYPALVPCPNCKPKEYFK